MYIYTTAEMRNNSIKGLNSIKEVKIQKVFRDKMAFEVDPEEWVEFCLGEQARVRGAC